MTGSGRRDAMSSRLLPMAAFVAHGTQLRPNDGMVTVGSARWGEFQGCVPADHYDEIGQIGSEGTSARTGFDAADFYRHIAFGLSERGF